jgi:3-hydroxyisobutyrate dehydrogenase-like beta-hydroxyacid dehydrogenase
MASGPRIGFVGLGLMGSLMAASLRRAGFELTVWNRTGETAEQWAAEHGGRVASSPAEVADGAEAVVTMVVDGPQVHDVLLGEQGVAAGASAGLLCIDCSTIGPSWAREIGAELADRGLHLVDAPVTGSTPGARDGTLTIMVGGEADDLRRARTVLEAMGSTIVHAGPLGHGQAVKVISNAVSATNAATVAEALLAGAATGVDLDALVAVMANGSAASKMLELKAGPMRAHDYTPLFRVAHMAKDVALCLELSPFRGAELALDDLRAAERAGFAEADFAALLEAVEARTGRRLPGS